MVDDRESSPLPDNGSIENRRNGGNKRHTEGGKDIMHSMNNDRDETTPILTENAQELKGSNSDE